MNEASVSFNELVSDYNATLYVPVGSLSAYKSASGWKNFYNIVEMDFTAVDNVVDEGSNAKDGVVIVL